MDYLGITWGLLIVAWVGFHIYSALCKKDVRLVTNILTIFQLLVMLLIQLLILWNRGGLR